MGNSPCRERREQRISRVLGGSLVALAFILLLTQPAGASDSDAPVPVGSVGLLLGKAWAEDSEGKRRRLQTGDDVWASERIVTSDNGHVHLRFIDQALVSVRPGSRLEITEYRYDRAAPEDSVVRFTLEEGVTRSISGEAGSAARERFRLDTPVAAIGVRGTDFVVSATNGNVRARVNEGAIVVAPYSGTCARGALGPCAEDGVELASTAMQIIEVAEGQAEPVLHPSAGRQLLALADRRVEEEEDQYSARAAGSVSEETMSDVYQETVAMQEVHEQAAVNSESQEPSGPQDPSGTGGDSGPPQTGSGSEPGFNSAITPDQLAARQLVWGRFAGDSSEAGFALSWLDARQGRAVTVGNGEFGLYRNDSDGTRVDAGLGVVGFDLDVAQAFHEGAGGRKEMLVHGGELQIDFDQSRFSTSLRLESDVTGEIGFNSSGRVFSGGFFHNRSDDKNVAGAVSIDGREAGYFFDQRLGSGTIHGTTLWSAGE